MGNQTYNDYAPQVKFIQLGEVQVHMSALAAINEQEINTAESTEKMHVTTGIIEIGNTAHVIKEELMSHHNHEVVAWSYLMTQFNLKPVLQKFRERGAKAAVLELTQLHIINTWAVMDSSQLSKEERAKVLPSQCRKINGQACTNGALQRAYIPKEDAALPTVSTESMFIVVPMEITYMDTEDEY
jgi:hypothetical protein